MHRTGFQLGLDLIKVLFPRLAGAVQVGLYNAVGGEKLAAEFTCHCCPRFLQQVIQQACIVLLRQVARQQLFTHIAGQGGSFSIGIAQAAGMLCFGSGFAFGHNRICLALGVLQSCSFSFSACFS